MGRTRQTPADIARALRARDQARPADSYRRQSYAVSRDEARAIAREWFAQYPKQAYMTQVESWQELPDGRIAFTMRRLPSAD